MQILLSISYAHLSISLSPGLSSSSCFSLTLLSAGLSSGFRCLANVLDMDYTARPHQKKIAIGLIVRAAYHDPY